MAPGWPAVAGRPYQASPPPGAIVARTGTGASHRRRRGAARIDPAPEVVPV